MATVSPVRTTTDAESLRVIDASAIAYRLYDIGYEIDLDRASALFAPDAATRDAAEPSSAVGTDVSTRT